MNLKNFLLFGFLLFSIAVKGQENCSEEDTMGYNPSFLMDGEGNCFKPASLALPLPTSFLVSNNGICQCGIFELYFKDVIDNVQIGGVGYGFNDPTLGQTRRDITCRAYSDLSILLQNSPNAAPVRIEIAKSTEPIDVGVAGIGGSYYYYPLNIATFAQGMVEKAIISGQDPYLGLVAYDPNLANNMPHGKLQINFSTAGNFDLLATNNAPLPSGTSKLYSVVLHEATHSLGIGSGIDANGQSTFTANGLSKVYRTFDQFLRKNGSPFLTVTSAGGIISDISMAAGNMTGINCNIDYNGSVNIPIYSPQSFVSGSSFSHFQCPVQSGTSFVMQSGTNNTSFNMSYDPLEVSVLCDLGYQTTNQYGQNAVTNGISANTERSYSVNCTPCSVVGNHDGFFANGNMFEICRVGGALPCGTADQITLSITDDLLANDLAYGTPATGILPNSVQILQGGGMITTITSSSITYEAAQGYSGWAILSYIPTNGNCTGTNTFVYIYVHAPTNTCPINANLSCNIVCNGNFENYSTLITQPYTAAHTLTNLFRVAYYPNWPSNTPDLYWGLTNPQAINALRTYLCLTPYYLSNYIPLDLDNNSVFIGIYQSQNCTPSSIEAFHLPLNRILNPNAQYQLKMRVSTGCPTADIFAVFCENPPNTSNIMNDIRTYSCIAGQAFDETDLPTACNASIPFPTPSNFSDGIGAKETIRFTFPTTDDDTDPTILHWQNISSPIFSICSTNTNLGHLIIHMDPYNQVGLHYYLFDDIELVEIGNIAYSVVPNQSSFTICPNQQITIPYTVSNPSTTPVIVDLTANIPPLFSYASGGDFVNGAASINLGAGQSQVVNLVLNTPSNTTVVPYEIQLTATSSDPNACLASGLPTITVVGVNIINPPPPNLSINISPITTTTTIASAAIYQVTITNNSGQAISNVTLADAGSTGLSGINLPAPFSLAAFGAGATTTFTINATTTACFLELCLQIISSNVAGCVVNMNGVNDCENSVTINPTNFIITQTITATNPATNEVTITTSIDIPTGTSNFTFSHQIPSGWAVSVGSPINQGAVTAGIPQVFVMTLQAQSQYFCDLVLMPNFALCIDVFDACNNVTQKCLNIPNNASLGLPTIVSASTIDAAVLASQLLPVSGTINAFNTPQTVILSNDIALTNGTYHFASGSKIWVNAGKKIEVRDKTKLELRNAHLQGCMQLWQGIVVQANATLESSASRIEDAVYAVEAHSGINLAGNNVSAQLAIRQTTFNRNYVGIYIPEPTGIPNNMVLFNVFSDNVFDCDAPLLPPYNGQTVNSLQFGYAGIEMHKQISFHNQFPNIFRNLANGIVAYEVPSIKIDRKQFFNIQPRGYGGDTDGSGIYTKGNAVGLFVLNQNGVGVSPSFDNCYNGVKSELYHLEIRNNQMTNIAYTGIESTGAYLILDIYNNNIRINNTKGAAGIRLKQNNSTISTKIYNNTINIGTGTTNSYALGGITVEDGNVPNPNTYSIDNNIITVQRALHGIYLNSNKGATVINNTIRLQTIGTTVSRNAIGLYYGAVKEVSKNTVTISPTGTTFTPATYGIYTQNTVDTKYECNTLFGTEWGMQFNGACGSAPHRISGNTFQTNNIGLHYTQNAVTGQQGTQNGSGGQGIGRGNKWIQPWTGQWGARHEGLTILDITASLYRVRSNGFGSAFMPIQSTPNTPPNQWFKNQAQANFVCSSSLLSPQIVQVNEVDEAIANGNNIGGSYANRWRMKANLYEKLSRNPQLLQQNLLMQQFYNTHTQQTIGNIIVADNYRIDAMQLNGIDQQQITQDKNQYGIYVDSLLWLDSLLVLGGINDTIWANQQISIFTIWQAQINNTFAFYNNLQNQRINASQLAQAMNLGIVPTNLIEENEQKVNEVFSQTAAIGSYYFTLNQKQTIEDVSILCPELHGTAVYRARSLRALAEYQEYVDNCDSGQPQARIIQDTCWLDVPFNGNLLLDGIIGPDEAPYNWVVCEETPNMHNYYPNSLPYPSVGDSYSGMGGADFLPNQTPPYPIFRESIGHELATALIKGEHYKFLIDFAQETQGKSAAISITLGDTLCGRSQIIHIGHVNDTIWETQVVDFVPNKNYRYMLISGEVPQNIPPQYTQGGYGLVDNIRHISCIPYAQPDTAEKAPILNVNELEIANFNISPNPNNNGVLLVNWGVVLAHGKIAVIDALGRNVGYYKIEQQATQQQINIEKLSSGFYTVLLQNEYRIMARAKLIIAKQ